MSRPTDLSAQITLRITEARERRIDRAVPRACHRTGLDVTPAMVLRALLDRALALDEADEQADDAA